MCLCVGASSGCFRQFPASPTGPVIPSQSLGGDPEMASAGRASHGGLEFEFIMVVLFAYWQGFGKQSSLCLLSFMAGIVQEWAPL